MKSVNNVGKDMKCRLCSNENTYFLFEGEDIHGRQILSNEKFSIYECNRCGAVFTDITVDNQYYDKYYLKDYYEENFHSVLVKKFFDLLLVFNHWHRYKIIKKFRGIGNKILEIGCGKGGFLHWLPDDFEKYAVEVNKDACAFIRENYRDITVSNSFIDDSFSCAKDKFDIIIMWHVFEHVNDPDNFVKNISRLLSRDGVLIFDVPNRGSLGFSWTKAKWFHLDTPRHLFHYAYKTVKNLFEKYGMQIVSCKGDTVDSFQDFSLSYFQKIKTNNAFVDALLLLFVALPLLVIRALVALLVSSKAEINTYVVKHAGEANNKFLISHEDCLKEELKFISLKYKQKKNFLDVGCGDAIRTILFDEFGRSLTGIDCADWRRGDLCNRIKFYQEDFIKFGMSFGNKSFDLINSFDVIEHLPEPEIMLKEINRLLEKDGVFIVSTPNRHRLLGFILILLGMRKFPYYPDATTAKTDPYAAHVIEYTASDLEKLLNGAGFKVISKHFLFYGLTGRIGLRRLFSLPFFHNIIFECIKS